MSRRFRRLGTVRWVGRGAGEPFGIGRHPFPAFLALPPFPALLALLPFPAFLAFPASIQPFVDGPNVTDRDRYMYKIQL